MLTPLGGAAGRALGRSTPAPTGGWNARDSLADMAPDHAVQLDNWFPQTSNVRIRRGFAQHASGVGAGAVDTLFEFAAGITRKLLAAGGGAIFEATAAGAVGAALGSGFACDRWQHVQFGGYAILVNGADTPRKFDGATLTTTTITGAGLTATNLIAVNEFKSRLFFVEKDTLNAWYLGTNAIAGAAGKLDFSTFCKLGGTLAAMGTWSRDGGAGADDVAVFVTSMGEALVFQGSDPADPNDWALTGVFRIGAPVGRRCLMKLGPDLVVITADGFVPLSRVLPVDRGAPQFALSDRIGNAVNAAVRDSGARFGWEGIVYPKAEMALFNVPAAAGVTAQQFVMNLATGAWCRFTGMNANCWALGADDLYFGGAGGNVYRADTGTADDGATIVADAKSAFTYFGAAGRLKRFTMVRPNLASDGAPVAALDLNVDFEDRAPVSIPTLSGAGNAAWDVTGWDVGEWGDAAQVVKDWLGVTGVGYAAALRMRIATDVLTVSWQSTDWLFEPGGIL